MKYRLKKNILLWFVWTISLLVISCICTPYIYELKYGYEIKNNFDVFIYSFVIIILLSIPSFILWVNYYINNKDCKISIGKKDIKIEYNNVLKSYIISDIRTSNYVLNSYQKDVFWSGFLGYSNLSYWDLTFKNGDRYFISSLLIDLGARPIIEETTITYSIFPLINKTDPILIKEKVEKMTIKRIEKLKSNFETKTVTELNEMLNNKSKYQQEAIIAIKEILKNKNDEIPTVRSVLK
jgi:hypothetical protein